MSGQTDLGICNLALLDLGQPALVTGNEDNKAGRLFRTSYNARKLEIMRTHPWRCLRAQAVLTTLPDAPPFGFDFALALPSDFLKVVKVNDNIDKFEIIGNTLQCDDDAPNLTYIANKSADMFDPLLVGAISSYCAWKWCISFTESANKSKDYKQTFSEVLSNATFNDALDGAPEDPPIGTWGEARLSEA